MRTLTAALLFACALSAQARPDGLYAELRTSKGLIVARLEPDMTPLAVANFVGLAEGTIANAAFDPGHPFFDGTTYHRVIPGHVIQTGIPKSDRARNPGYSFPNEIHARLSHNHTGALNMANSGPHTNSSQFCIMLGDRSYLDGNFTVFGDVVEGMDVVTSIVQGDVLETVRILRVGAKAQAYHPTTESWNTMLAAAKQRVIEHEEKKRLAERDWIAKNYPKAEIAQPGAAPVAAAPLQFRYRAKEVRYRGDVIGREGPPLEITAFASGDNGIPAFIDSPRAFTPAKINPGLDAALATMHPGEHRVLIVPAALAYSRAGYYAPETPGQRRLVISPFSLLVYEIDALEK